MSRVVSLDYETYFTKKEYSVSKMGNWRYTHDTEFDPYLLSAYDGEETWVGNPVDFNWESVQGDLIIAHNAGFDRSVTERLAELGSIPPYMASQNWQCTANMTAFLADERSLRGAIKVLEHRNLSKEAREEMNGIHWRDLSPEKQKRMLDYAAGDVHECHGLWTKYSPQWPEFEQELSRLTMNQCSRGVRINVPLLEEYIQVLQEVIFTLEQSLP